MLVVILLAAAMVPAGWYMLPAVSASAREMPAGEGFPHKTYVLDNGLTLLFQEHRAHPLIAIEIIVKTGSLYEGSRQGAGLAHLVEHMVFKGTPTRSAADINDAVRRLGGVINGYASHQFTGFSLVVPAENMRPGLSLLHDMLANPVFDEEELAREKDVILSEIRMNRDHPLRYISRLFWQYAYAVPPYNLPVIGLEPLFLQLEKKDVVDFHAQWYMPNNMVIGISGSRSPDEVRDIVGEIFGAMPMRPYPSHPLPALPLPASPVIFTQTYEGRSTYLMMGVPSVDLAHPDAPVLDVLAGILGDGESSRLYQRLVKEDRSAYSVSAFNYTPRFRGIFGFRAMVEHADIKRVADAIFEETQRLSRERVSAAELTKVKNRYIGEYVRGRQTVQAKAGQIATDFAYVLDPHFSLRYLESLSRVSAEDIQRCADQYMQRARLTTVILSPHESDAEADAVAAQPSASAEMRRVTLDNGVRVLLRPDPADPVVAVHLIAAGGVRYEQEKTNGLFHAMSLMFTRGSRRFSATKVSAEMATWGGSLAGFSGHNSFGLSLEILSENVSPGLDMALDCFLRPAFHPEELTLLKNQTIKAIDVRHDDIFSFTMDHMRQALFSQLPFRFPSVGNKEAVSALTPGVLEDYHRRFLVPENIVVSVCGDFDAVQVESQLRRALGKLRARELPGAEIRDEPPRTERLILSQQREREQAVIVYGFPSVDIYHPDRRTVELLGHILTNPGSVLYSRIREESGMAYTLGGYARAGLDGGYFLIYAATAPENVDQVIAMMDEEIEQVRRGLIPADVVNAGKNQVISHHAIRLQTQEALGFTTGLDELYGLGFDAYQRYPEQIRAITPEMLYEAARAYLAPERGVVAITRQ